MGQLLAATRCIGPVSLPMARAAPRARTKTSASSVCPPKSRACGTTSAIALSAADSGAPPTSIGTLPCAASQVAQLGVSLGRPSLCRAVRSAARDQQRVAAGEGKPAQVGVHPRQIGHRSLRNSRHSKLFGLPLDRMHEVPLWVFVPM